MKATDSEDKYETTEEDHKPDDTSAIVIFGNIVIRDVETGEIVMKQRF
jgi:hypothetical protein